MPTIMAGVNQTLMLALSMVVIASMIAVGGLGQMVLRGIGRLDMGACHRWRRRDCDPRHYPRPPDAGRWGATHAVAAIVAGTPLAVGLLTRHSLSNSALAGDAGHYHPAKKRNNNAT